MRRERVMNSCGGFPMRAGRRRVGSEAADPIGVALSITAGERSHPRTETPHHSDPMGVELHAVVVRTAGCRPVCVGFSAVSIGRSAASLLRGCACGLPAVIDVGPLWGPHIYMLPVRRFAFGSPAVIESSPPMGAQASRCDYGRWRTFCRMGICLRVRRDESRLTRSGRQPRHGISGDSPATAFLPAPGRPGGERRDESRLYVADFPCG